VAAPLLAGVVVLVASVSMVHEQMHQWAGSQKEIGQHTKNMCGMLREKKEDCDKQKAKQNDSRPGSPPDSAHLLVHNLPPALISMALYRSLEGWCGPRFNY
jgi:hypothetical protein